MNRHHTRVLQAIFEHPIARNLEWPDVVSLVRHLGSVTERHDGKYEFQIGNVRAVFTKPHDKDVDAAGIVELRRFLSDAGVNAQGTVPEAPATQNSPTVVLIDHHRARFYERSSDGWRFDESADIEPKDPHGFERHLEHRKEAHYKGERVPEADEFYERVAQRLKNAPSIVLVGDATGKSSAMNYLLDYLKEKHKDVAARVAATAHEDLSHVDAGDIERLALV